MRRLWPLSLRTVLLTVNLAVLLLPIGGIVTLRLYESELIRQTESELLAQGAFVAAAFREAHRGLRALAPEADQTSPVGFQEDGTPLPSGKAPLDPRPPRLDIARARLRPPAPAPLPIAAPLSGEAALAGARVEPLLRAASRATLAGIRVVDPTGRVVASSGGSRGASLAQWEEVYGALRGEDVRILRERNSDERFSLASISRGSQVRVFIGLPVVDGGEILGAVVLSRTPLTPAKALYQNRGTLLLGGAALIGLAVMVSILTALTIGRPVERLIRQSRRVARGEAGGVEPIASPGTREVDELSQAFAQMAQTLSDRATYIQAFASGVSHEFKTPLASMKGSVELLQDHLGEMDEGERARFLTILAKDVDRLDRLVGRLLELARAEVAVPSAGVTDARGVAEEVAARFTGEGFPVAVALEPGPLPVPMGREILESVLYNLIENARQHGGPGTEVRITGGIVAGRGVLEIADTGRGISPGNLPRVFDAFFTTARGDGGTGLGLSVSRAHLEAHGGRIVALPSPRGLHLRLEFP